MGRSLAFYRHLGLEIPPDADQAPHAECELSDSLTLAWDTHTTILAFDPDWTPASGGHSMALCFRCADADDVDAVFERMTNLGYAGHRSPWDAVWRQRYAVLHDPDGHQVELFAPLG